MRRAVAFLGVALSIGLGWQPFAPAGPIGATVPARGSAAAAGVDAAGFLAAARGTRPAICSLAAAPLANRWGRGNLPTAASADEAALVEWALQPSVSDRDLTVLEQGLADEDPCVRTMAGRLLAAADVAGFRILVAGLRHERPDTRRAAAEGLGLTDDADAALEPLLPVLDDEDPRVRAAAARAIGELY